MRPDQTEHFGPVLSPPRIVCAAVRHPAGLIVCGPRHFDSTMWCQILGVTRREFDILQAQPGIVRSEVKEWGGAEEGFIDQHGKFYSREDAWPVALGNSQIDPQELMWQTGRLHSEHLY